MLDIVLPEILIEERLASFVAWAANHEVTQQPAGFGALEPIRVVAPPASRMNAKGEIRIERLIHGIIIGVRII